MKLKKLEVTGFKSFYDKTTIEFPHGISAIVGPNGCGKSNVIDALRWVMGEQSVKQLRGKSMEDIIFSGTNGHSPLNMAEVSLVLRNDNGSAPEELRDYAEIMLTRRLYRSGESAYLLNKRPCRLKDITNIFLGSGMGAKSYALIQQGNIGAITEAGPDERRHFLEEAAGTTRYKARKIEALRKVKSTQQNLLRLDDLISEIKRQMNSLKRQAAKARRFKKYRAVIRDLDIRLGLHYHADFGQKLTHTATLLSQLKDDDLAQSSKLSKIDAAVEAIRLKRQQKNQQIAAQKADRFQIQRTIDKAENDLAHGGDEIKALGIELTHLETAKDELYEKNADLLREVEQTEQQLAQVDQKRAEVRQDLKKEQDASASLRSQFEQLNQGIEQKKATLMDLVAQEARYKNIHQNVSTNKDTLRRRLKQKNEEEVIAKRNLTRHTNRLNQAETHQAELTDTAAELDADIEALRERATAASAQLGNQVQSVREIEDRRTDINSQYKTLRKMEENLEWYKDGVKAVLKAHRDDSATAAAAMGEVDIKGLTADVISPEPGYEAAVEAALGDSLQYVITGDQGSGRQAIAYLTSNGAGRCGFIPLDGIKPETHTAGKLPANANRLLDHVRIKPGFDQVAAALLGDVVVIEDLEAALNLFNANGMRRTIVTRTGELVSARGLMSGGGKDAQGGILSKKSELQQLAAQVALLEEELHHGKEAQIAAEEALKAAENLLQKKVVQRNQITQETIEAEKQVYKTGEDVKQAERQLEIVQLEQEQMMGEAMDLDDEIARYNAALQKICAEVEAAQNTVKTTSAKIESLSHKLTAYDQRRMDLKLQQTALEAQWENHTHSLRRLKAFQGDGVERAKQLENDIAQKTERRERMQHQAAATKQALVGQYDQLERMSATLDTNESEYQAFESALKENEDTISSIQSQREEILQKTRLLEIEQSQLKVRQDNVIQRLEDRYHLNLEDMEREVAAADQDPKRKAIPSVEELEAALADTQKRLAAMGDVNLAAIEEFKTLEERHDFITSQREDLVKAMTDLHSVIRKINRITQKRLLETLDNVNEKLKIVFPRLFQGGRARLDLTEPDNPLESGVEYYVQPPGKKLTRMSLLSGGEKALSAIAFIFSIFLLRPASFCLLDEIDAPLDDANVVRFNELLKIIGEQSQVVMVTHNKRSMEFAETLFGITMEQKGISKIVSVNFDGSQN